MAAAPAAGTARECVAAGADRHAIGGDHDELAGRHNAQFIAAAASMSSLHEVGALCGSAS